jgi:hypothetical protein
MTVVDFCCEERLVCEASVDESGQVEKHEAVTSARNSRELLRLIVLLLLHLGVELGPGKLLLS